MSTANLPAIRACRPAWNKGRIVGQKRPLQPKHVWAIRVRLEIAHRTRELALFNLAIDSKLRGCDLVRLKVADVYDGETRATIDRLLAALTPILTLVMAVVVGFIMMALLLPIMSIMSNVGG